MKIIYIDVLLLLNLYVTFFLIRGACAFLHRRISTSRAIIGSLLGALSALTILLPDIGGMLTIALKLLCGVVIVLFVFGFAGKAEFIKNTVVFLAINGVYAGIMLLLWFFSAPLGMVWHNGVAYFDLSFGVILASTAVAYGLIKLIRFLIDARGAGERKYTVTIENCGNAVTLEGISDSGNSLTDYFSGMPVIICGYEAAKAIVPVALSAAIDSGTAEQTAIKGVRLLPYTTVGGAGMIPTLRPERVTITCDGKSKRVDAMVGITDKNACGAVFSPKLII